MRGRPVVLGYYFTKTTCAEPRHAARAGPAGRGISGPQYQRGRVHWIWRRTSLNCSMQPRAPVISTRFQTIPMECIAGCLCSRSTRAPTIKPLSLAVVRVLLGSPARRTRLHGRVLVVATVTRVGVAEMWVSLRIPVDIAGNGARALSRSGAQLPLRLGQRCADRARRTAPYWRTASSWSARRPRDCWTCVRPRSTRSTPGWRSTPT